MCRSLFVMCSFLNLPFEVCLLRCLNDGCSDQQNVASFVEILGGKLGSVSQRGVLSVPDYCSFNAFV